MWLVGEVWVWLVGVVVRRYVYRFLHTTYPYSSSICSFFAVASLLFVHFFKKKIRSCSSTFW